MEIYLRCLKNTKIQGKVQDGEKRANLYTYNVCNEKEGLMNAASNFLPFCGGKVTVNCVVTQSLNQFEPVCEVRKQKQ
jgi:hypothetical protein